MTTNPRAFVVLSVVVMLLTDCTRTSPEQRFWMWFQSNEAALFDFEKDQERTFDRLGAEMHKIDSSLTFEFGPKQHDRREFTISAGGILEAFPKVEALYAAAPSLPRWKFVKFRQRGKPFDISYSGVSVKAGAVAVQVLPNGPKANLIVFMPGYSELAKQAYNAIAFLLLDQALGEYDVEMQVAGITVKSTSQARAQGCSLEELPKIFDELIARK
jgi:hypothetical protein